MTDGGANPSLGDAGARPLSPEDLSILALENETVAGHTCKVIVLESPIDPDRLRSSIAARMHRAPQLSARLAEVDGRPCWAASEDPDLTAHVLVADCPEPPDQTGLGAIAARTFEQRLDRSSPLWRLDLVPELAGGGSALIWRVHHALADGSTVMRMAAAALWDEEPDAAAPRKPRAHAAAPDHRDPATRRRLEGTRAAVRELPHIWHRSPLDGHIGARRSVAFAATELDGLRAAARAHGATVNDAVLCVVAGGLRRWLEARHGRLGKVRVKVPVSLHGPGISIGEGADAPGNRDSFFCLDVPLGPADPIERLTAIASATRVRKQGHDAEHLDALLRELAHTPRLREFVESVLAHPRSFAVNVSNVHGPQRPVRVLGTPVRALYTLAEIRDHHALRIAVVSLAETLTFGLVADPTLVGEVEQLADAMAAEAATLQSRA